MSDPSLVRFRVALEGALAHLESRREEINDLNVFPVADGDTGDNMALTLQACLEEVDRLAAVDRPVDEIGRDEIVESVARAALLGARGNSGVILSQLIRGAAEELVSRPGELIDPVLVGAAMARAAQRAYTLVRAPAEDTMLTGCATWRPTSLRARAHGASAAGAGRLAPVLNEVLADPWSGPSTGGGLGASRSRPAPHAARGGGRRRRRLRGNGHLRRGGGRSCAARAPRARPPCAGPTPSRARVLDLRYCTNFAVTGSGLEATAFVTPLEAMGDSVLVVGDPTTLKVHVHTDDPERALALFAGVGESRTSTWPTWPRRSPGAGARRNGSAPAQARSGALAWWRAGVARLYAWLGCDVLDGGGTFNPSTSELLAGIHAVAAEEVVVLPNSANVIMAAERAAELAEKGVGRPRARPRPACPPRWR